MAVVAEIGEVCAFARVKIVWKLCQRLAVIAEAIEIGARARVKIVWKLGQSVAAVAEVGEVSRCVSVASVIVNEVEALQYVIESAQTV